MYTSLLHTGRYTRVYIRLSHTGRYTQVYNVSLTHGGIPGCITVCLSPTEVYPVYNTLFSPRGIPRCITLFSHPEVYPGVYHSLSSLTLRYTQVCTCRPSLTLRYTRVCIYHPFHCWASNARYHHPFHCWASNARFLPTTRFTVGLKNSLPSPPPVSLLG